MGVAEHVPAEKKPTGRCKACVAVKDLVRAFDRRKPAKQQAAASLSEPVAADRLRLTVGPTPTPPQEELKAAPAMPVTQGAATAFAPMVQLEESCQATGQEPQFTETIPSDPRDRPADPVIQPAALQEEIPGVFKGECDLGVVDAAVVEESTAAHSPASSAEPQVLAAPFLSPAVPVMEVDEAPGGVDEVVCSRGLGAGLYAAGMDAPAAAAAVAFGGNVEPQGARSNRESRPSLQSAASSVVVRTAGGPLSASPQSVRGGEMRERLLSDSFMSLSPRGVTRRVSLVKTSEVVQQRPAAVRVEAAMPTRLPAGSPTMVYRPTTYTRPPSYTMPSVYNAGMLAPGSGRAFVQQQATTFPTGPAVQTISTFQGAATLQHVPMQRLSSTAVPRTFAF
eukprot:TRINITY_DN84089_c0_g1_i1.p1 TRINITY_DN84089_c0_g1~~TRINITY_DN84089_c0_g1_i1.p1  ORF type:complete len:394 (-),score=85.08 TRINITY_DN84089_c0_g1_i1:103-1284(-)